MNLFKLLKLMKSFFTVLLISAFVFVFRVSAAADDLNIAVNTSDDAIIWIIIAVIALIATTFITTKLTKRKNNRQK